jgi:hypothetical protein
MDLIYNNSEVTIIAAAGQNPFYGLPGVSSRHRNPQVRAKIGKHLWYRHWKIHAVLLKTRNGLVEVGPIKKHYYPAGGFSLLTNKYIMNTTA